MKEDIIVVGDEDNSDMNQNYEEEKSIHEFDEEHHVFIVNETNEDATLRESTEQIVHEFTESVDFLPHLQTKNEEIKEMKTSYKSDSSVDHSNKMSSHNSSLNDGQQTEMACLDNGRTTLQQTAK